jgi:inner membrane protein COX18
VIEEALQLSHAAFQGVHTLTGLPWYLSIPLTASLFRFAWMPLQILTSRDIKRAQVQAPLLVGWRKAYQGMAQLKFPGGTEANAKQAEAWVQSQLAARRQEIRKHNPHMSPWTRFGLQLSFLPIWILNADVIRRMSGDERTMLSLFFKTSHDKVDTSIVPLEPQFLSEGFLWIPNLVSPDDLWILPMTFGALSVASAWMYAGQGIKKQQARLTAMPPGPMKTREAFFLQLSQFVVAASFVFPVFLIRSETASAVVLYLIGSVATQLVQRPLVNWLVGGTKGIEPLEPRVPRQKGKREPKT